MPEYVERMNEEYKALRAKLYALRGFIKGKTFDSLKANKKLLLTRQLLHMEEYAKVLSERIALEVEESIE